MVLSNEMAKAVRWVDRNIADAPDWAKYMICARANQHYGHFYEKKPKWDPKAGCFYNPGKRTEHFRDNTPGPSVYFNIKSGHISLKESGEQLNYNEFKEKQEARVAQGHTSSPRCAECGTDLTDENCSATPRELAAGFRTCKIDYDVQCFNCWKRTTIRVRVLSMFHIKDAEYENV